MAQQAYSDAGPAIGNVSNSNPITWGSVRNTRAAQVTDIDIAGTTTDGSYVATLRSATGVLLATATYVASSKTAAQIAAGLAAAILADPTFRGFISGSVVAETDHVRTTFQLSMYDALYALSYSGPTGPVIAQVTAPGYTVVPLGIILCQDTLGGFVTTYTDARLALGVTARTAGVSVPETYGGTVGFDGTDIDVVQVGAIDVEISSGITVLKGEKAYFNATTATWSNVTTGSHVLVEGAAWQTSGTTIQTVYVNLPSES
jgi:hypothetical protein